MLKDLGEIDKLNANEENKSESERKLDEVKNRLSISGKKTEGN